MSRTHHIRRLRHPNAPATAPPDPAIAAESAGSVAGAAEGTGPGASTPAGPGREGSAQRAVAAETWLAPPVRHVLAFTIDFAAVAVVAAVPGGAVAWLFSRLTDARPLASFAVFALALAFGFGVYSAICLWLIEGQTAGKAMLGLAVHRMPGGPPRPDLRGLAWAAGRCLAGYAVIDVLGLGMLMALVTRGRRSVHDYVFDSQVVLAAEAGRADPEAALARLRDWDKRRQAAQAEVAERYGWPLRLVKWLARIVTLPVRLILVLGSGTIGQPIVGWLSKVAGHTTGKPAAAAHTVAPAAKATVVIATTAVAATVAVTGAWAISQPSIGGVWGQSVRVERTGADAYTGTLITSTRDPVNGCVWPQGQVVWRIEGNGPRYHGEQRWVSGSGGQDCTFRWAKDATFILRDGGDTLQRCSTDPWNSSRRECDTWRRTT
jgi:hypothetical protein